MSTLLVIGAREGGLGDYVAKEARAQGFDVVTAGVTTEDVKCDFTNAFQTNNLFTNMEAFSHVVCTIGVNRPDSIVGQRGRAEGPPWELSHHFERNVFAPLVALHYWLTSHEGVTASDSLQGGSMEGKHFAAISSNSAHIARRGSMSYCASKAALSMALRVAAREQAWSGVQVYGYEPGWLEGTPMSDEVLERFGGRSMAPAIEVHRIPHARSVRTYYEDNYDTGGILPGVLARMIVENLYLPRGLNGCMIRIDGGEQ